MDELIQFTENHDEIQFLVSLDYNIDGYQTDQEYYSCLDWANLYSELGDFGNNPLILNGDPDHYIWNMFSGSTYSAYAFIDHNMVVRYLLGTPNLNDFKYNYIPTLLSLMYGCTDDNESDNPNCWEAGDINIDGSINIFDIVIIIDFIILENYNYIVDMNLDNTLDIIDIIQLLNIIL